MRFPRIWVIGVKRRGADLQAIAVAEELGLPFETRTLQFNWRYWLAGNYMGASAASVERRLRERTLVPPWPDLILLAGKRAVPVALWVQKQSGGRTRLVMIGHPRVSPESLDLIYTTGDYCTPNIPSVHRLPVTMSRYRRTPEATDEERSWLDSLPRPHWLLMIGGKTRHWKMRPEHIAGVAANLASRVDEAGGSLIAVRSARTAEAVVSAVESRLEAQECEWRVVRHDFPRFPVLLEDADVLFPTADSISMISESVITGKPVGIVPVERSWLGWLELGSERKLATGARRDLRRFWNFLLDNRLAGTMDEPIASDTPNPVIAAAKEVRGLLENSFGKISV